MKDFNILIHYNKLALSDEDNQFVSHYLEEGCKITAEIINEKYNPKFNIKIDYLCLTRSFLYQHTQRLLSRKYKRID